MFSYSEARDLRAAFKSTGHLCLVCGWTKISRIYTPVLERIHLCIFLGIGLMHV